MISCLYVALGGALGSVSRYLIGLIPLSDSVIFPYKTLIINTVGSFLIGLTVSLLGSRAAVSPNMMLFLKVGFCGGFTTFSTFALETTGLIQNGEAPIAALYIVLSVLLSVGAVFLSGSLVK